MEPQAKILFVCPFENAEAKAFVDSLAQGLKHWNIQVSDSGLRTFLFEAKKFDVAHFFLPVSGRAAHRAVRKGSKTKIVQTLLNTPADADKYKKSILGNHVVTFSEQEKTRIQKQFPDVSADVILPCAARPPVEKLESASSIRERYDVRDRLFAVALNDFSDQKHFTTFLYTVREYQRRGGYRFVIPLYSQDRKSLLWRQRLKNAIVQEKLSATTLLDVPVDLHSLIDATDVTLYIDKRQEREFSFPLRVVEALCAGKPLISYNIPPVSEIVGAFRKEWLAIEYEDFSRISRDLHKHAGDLEQISTELARFARARMSVEKVAERYKNLYNSLFSL